MPYITTTIDMTLDEALNYTAKHRWHGTRSYARNLSQASVAVMALERVVAYPGTLTVSKVTMEQLREATAKWYGEGIAPATINCRLNCLAAMGVNVEGTRVKVPKVRKWWLNPEAQEAVTAWLRSAPLGAKKWSAQTREQVADFIDWTVWTGLRIEESLRVCRADVTAHTDARKQYEAIHAGTAIPPTHMSICPSRTSLDYSLTVQGTKTAGSQATLPLSSDAADLLRRRLPLRQYPHVPSTGEKLFTITYDELLAIWQTCRAFLGESDTDGATLKALRRSAARYLHTRRNMPLDMVREYLRHDDIETTMGYLRLTGGYGEEEMRKWL